MTKPTETAADRRLYRTRWAVASGRASQLALSLRFAEDRCCEQVEEIDRLRAEIKRLRGLMMEIACLDTSDPDARLVMRDLLKEAGVQQ